MHMYRLSLAKLFCALCISILFSCKGRGCRHESPPPIKYSELVVPHVTTAIHCDGELDENEWFAAANSGPFIDLKTNQEAHPYSEARFLWDDQNLYITLYAADDDIRTADAGHDGPLWLGDAFTLRFSVPSHDDEQYSLDVAPNGIITDAKIFADKRVDTTWESHAIIGVDSDGTLNDPSDADEEWVVEMAIPLRSLGLTGHPNESMKMKISRCDTPKNSKRVCGAWGAIAGTSVLAGMLRLGSSISSTHAPASASAMGK